MDVYNWDAYTRVPGVLYPNAGEMCYLSQARSIRKQGLRTCMGAQIYPDLLQYIL